MKILPILFGLLLSGFIYSSTDIIRNIEVMTHYTFVTSNKHYYFRVKVSSLDNMYIELEARNIGSNSENDFKVDICGFYDYPTDAEVMYGHEYCANAKVPTLDRRSDSDLVYYRYTFSSLKDINYLSLSLTMLKSNIYPYSLFIYSESGMQEALADPN